MMILEPLWALFKDAQDSKAPGKESMASIKGEDSLFDKEIERKPEKFPKIMPSGLLFSFDFYTKKP